MTAKKTSLWRSVAESQVLVAEIPGLPDPIPRIAFRVRLPEYGDGVCIGYGYADEKTKQEVVEVKLLIKWNAEPAPRPRG